MQGQELDLLDLLDRLGLLGPMDLLDLIDRPGVCLAGVAAGLALALIKLVKLLIRVETGLTVWQGCELAAGLALALDSLACVLVHV